MQVFPKALPMSAMLILLHPQLSSAEVPQESATHLGVVTVSANKTETPLNDIAAAVEVVDEQDMEAQMIATMADITRYLPGVSVSDGGSRFGPGDISIRGLGGNRVLQEVDGVPVSDAFAIGSYSDASRYQVDPLLLKQVEIIKGPASALFGSDALGGVVSYVTRDPSDLLRGDDGHFFQQRLQYDERDSGFTSTSIGAFNGASVDALISIGHRQSEERDLAANGISDPLDSDQISGLVKLVWDNDPTRTSRLWVDLFRGANDTEVDSLETIQDFTAQFGFPYLIDTEEVRAEDESERTLVAFEQDYDFGGSSWLDTLNWKIFAQNSETEQRTLETRSSLIGGTTASVFRDRQFHFDQQAIGGEAVATKMIGDHQWVGGISYRQTETEQLRTGTETDLIHGGTSNQVGPDDFPVRDFPNSTTTKLGAYTFMDFEALDGRLSITPGMRIDYYDLDPSPDAIFLGDNPGFEPAKIDELAVSPKLGVIYDFSDNYSGYLQIARGFRAPPFDDVNFGFTNFQFGYTSIPNPDLTAETSTGLELGLRKNRGNFRYTLSGWINEYDDFIQSLAAVGVNDQGLLVFQSINVDEARIHGFEAQFSWQPEMAEQWYLFGSVNTQKGTDKTTDTPLNSIEPAQAILGINYAPNNNWSLELRGRLSAAKDASDLDDPNDDLYRSGGFGVWDGFIRYQPAERWSLNLGVFNMADKSYLRWANVQGVSQDQASALSRRLSPGRHASVSIRFQF